MNNGYDPLRLSYHRYSHYNAILDPYKSSVGVGLGLAGYSPEEFEPTKQFNDAVQTSEQLEIEKMMVEDKLKTTDWEATSDVVVEQIARQSYLQYCKDNMSRSSKEPQKKLQKSTSTITSTEAGGSSSSSSAIGEVPGVQANSAASSSSNNRDIRDNDTDSTIEYYMQQQNSRNRRKRHQG